MFGPLSFAVRIQGARARAAVLDAAVDLHVAHDRAAVEVGRRHEERLEPSGTHTIRERDIPKMRVFANYTYTKTATFFRKL